MSANVKQIILDEKSWHREEWGLSGRYLQPNESLLTVAKEIGFYDVEISKLPQFVYITGEYVETGDYKLAYTNPTWTDVEFLNRNVNHYQPLQNSYLVDTFNDLSKTYSLSGLGMVGRRGQISFIQFKLPDFYIKDDLHESCLTIGDNKESGGTYYFRGTQRVVCENTWRMGIQGITPIPHGMDNYAMLQFLAVLENAFIKERNNEIELLNRMFTTRLPKDSINKIVTRIFPEPKKSKKLKLLEMGEKYNTAYEQNIIDLIEKETNTFENKLTRTENCKQGVVNEFFKMANNGYGNTVYSFFNGVTSYVNHSDNFQGDKSYGIMFSNRGDIMEKAWSECVKVLK